MDSKQFDFKVSMKSDVGCTRKNNEDSIFYVYPPDENILKQKGLLAIVADGMGGHQAGEVASQMAVEKINQHYYQQTTSVKQALEEAFYAANEAIYSASLQQSNLTGMGTTGTALVIIGNQIFCGHVGDSRLYRVRKREIQQLTQDHTVVREWVVDGLISEEEARHHHLKNIITRSLGTHPAVDIDCLGPYQLEIDDIYILCSDGLVDLVSDNEIAKIAATSQEAKDCEELIALAKERGGFDNISVITVTCQKLE